MSIGILLLSTALGEPKRVHLAFVLPKRETLDKQVMGEYVNGGFYNVMCWASDIVLTGVSVVYVASMFLID
jgi:Mn2+/Fe2+ NRAMP family transporter